MYGRNAGKLLRELASSESGHLTSFNNVLFDKVVQDCNEHHLQLQSLMRYHRLDMIRCMRRKVGCELPEEIKQRLVQSERDYFKNHSLALESYMSELDLELTVDMVPPKDPYIQVHVLDDIGDVLLSSAQTTLLRHSVHSLRCTDAEPYISQGLMVEFLG